MGQEEEQALCGKYLDLARKNIAREVRFCKVDRGPATASAAYHPYIRTATRNYLFLA